MLSMQGPQDIGWRSLRGLLQALVPSLLMNVHIVGLNQIFDVEIDKVQGYKNIYMQCRFAYFIRNQLLLKARDCM